ncbi:MAG: hypothetical protein ACW99U_13760 [Candidatus Thorarchaeota archaeon]|jgi:hypothetical protein
MSEEFGLEQAGEKIIFALNIGHGIFMALVSLFGVIFVFDVGPVLGLVLGLVLVVVSWMFLRPVKKEGWMYAFILNIVIIPVAFLLIPFPIWVYSVTFAVLVIIFMLVPQFRKPFT